MASAAASPASSASSGRRPPQGSLRRTLILGFCFGIGYGITDRLVNLQFTPNGSAEQRFEVRPFPGTELQSFRRRSGDSLTPIRADLDRIEAERQQKREAADMEKRRAALESRDNAAPVSGDPIGMPPLPEPGRQAEPPAPQEAPALPPASPVASPSELPAAPAVRPPAATAPTP